MTLSREPGRTSTLGAVLATRLASVSSIVTSTLLAAWISSSWRRVISRVCIRAAIAGDAPE
ncbi:MAG TPA: hypothetical protein VIB78_07330 [Acidimicrobiia bacterium]